MGTEDPIYPTSGQPWDTDLLTTSLDEQLTERIDINMASVIIIDGGQGQGKTTFAVQIADYYNKKRGFPPIDLSIKNHKQIGLGGVDFITKFNKCKQAGLPVMIYDEAGDYSKASTMSWFNYQLSKLFQKIRSAKIIIIMCMPNFNILDNRLFDDEIIRGFLHCNSRQVTKTYGNFSAYSIDGFSWIRHWFNKLPTARRSACYSMCTPLFRGRFKNLPKQRAMQLEILSNYGKDKERAQAEVSVKGLIDIKEISRKTSRSIIWIRTKIAKLKIKPEETIGKLNYYNKNALAMIEAEMK